MDAADELTRIVERIRKDNPDAARRVVRTIYRRVAELRRFPHRGRSGMVHVLRIRHAATRLALEAT